MNTIDRDLQLLLWNDYAPKLERAWVQLYHSGMHMLAAVRPVQRIVSLSVLSGGLFLLGLVTYLMHLHTIPSPMAMALFLLSFTGCALGGLSLVSEKGVSHSLQAAGGLIGNAAMAVIFLHLA